MPNYTLKYTVVIEADNFNMAELLSIDLEGDIRNINKKIKHVWGDPYMECDEEEDVE